MGTSNPGHSAPLRLSGIESVWLCLVPVFVKKLATVSVLQASAELCVYVFVCVCAGGCRGRC